ncbi:MAG: hypothetical protein ACI906_000552 [Candidatus Latescibacterota bacterium]|jgi:hypothetical protein
MKVQCIRLIVVNVVNVAESSQWRSDAHYVQLRTGLFKVPDRPGVAFNPNYAAAKSSVR